MPRLSKVRLGKGLVWRITDEGVPIYERRLTVQEVRSRIDTLLAPLPRGGGGGDRRGARAARLQHPPQLPFDAGGRGSHSTDFPGLVHADFVIGDRDGTQRRSRACRARSASTCESLGYNVSYNHPYKGVELVRRYGDPARHRHSIQVEINRRLYMDEQTLEPHAGLRAAQAQPALAGRAAAGAPTRGETC